MAHETPYITAGLLRQLLDYDPTTGVLRWRARNSDMFTCDRSYKTWNRRFAGAKATCADGYGYRKIGILGRKFQAHRVIWAMIHDSWPDQVDHINHDRSDNRIHNLREVTESCNKKNVSKSRRNTSGVVGVHAHGDTGLWRARITNDGVTVHLGLFSTLAEAAQARKAAEEKLGFHPNHGA